MDPDNPFDLEREADRLTDAGQSDEAQRLMTRAVRIHDRQAGRCRAKLALLLAEAGDFDTALAVVEPALAVSGDNGPTALHAQLLRLRARLLWDLGRGEDAIAGMPEAATAFQRLGDPEAAGICRLRLAEWFGAADRTTEAIDAYGAAAEDLQVAGHPLAAEVHRRRGSLLANGGRAPEALAPLETARALFEQAGDRAGVARCDNDLGLTQQALGRYTVAAEHLRAAWAGWDEAGQADDGVNAAMNLATVLEDQGELQQALYVHERVLAHFAEHGAPEDIARARQNLATTLTALGRSDEALKLLRTANAYYRRAGMTADVAGCEQNIGIALQHLDRIDEARVAYGRAAALYTQLGQPAQAARARHNMLIIASDDGRFDEVLAGAAEIEPLYRSAHLQNELADLADLVAEALAHAGRFDEALAQHERARRHYERTGARQDLAQCLSNTGWTLEMAGRHADALARSEAARAEYERLGQEEGVAWCDAGAAFPLARLGRTEEALARVAAAREVLAGADDIVGGLWCDWAEAVARAESGEVDAARALFERAIAGFRTTRYRATLAEVEADRDGSAGS